MARSLPREVLERQYEEAAQAYQRSLSPKPDTETTAQATQRKITLESLDLVSTRRPEVQVFNELLVEYVLSDGEKEQVVPNNMVVVWPEPIQADTCFEVSLQPERPFWVLEYVSSHHRRKDYDVSFQIYERDLKVPYCLMYRPDTQEMTLYRRRRARYVSVKPNAHDRCEVPELEMEVALKDGWVRFWYQGELLPLPAELLRALDETRRELHQERLARVAAEMEIARLRAQLEQQRKGPTNRS